MKVEDETWTTTQGGWGLTFPDGDIADFYEADSPRARLAACAPEMLRMLRRIAKYAKEDRATTARATRLARALEEADALIRKAGGE